MEHGVPISSGVETLARTGSKLHVLHHGKICGRDASVPDPRTWIWARAPRGTISVVFRGGCANRGDPLPNLQSSLDVFDARLVLSTTLDDTANLANRMTLFGLNQVWAADITYIRLANEFVYLAVVLDVFSREGYWLGSWAKSQIPTSLCALKRAIENRRPPPGVVHHSDQSVQYACQECVAKLRDHQMLPSMSRPSNPYDNATCESFPRTGFRNTSPGCEASGITRCWELSDARAMTSAINHTGVIARWLETKCPVRLRLWKMLHVRTRNWSS